MLGRFRIGLGLVGAMLLGQTPARADIINSPKALTPELRSAGPRGAASTEIDRAIEAFRTQQPDKALDHLRTACGQDGRLPPAPLMLARLQLAAGRIAPGRAALERAVAEVPAYPGNYLEFGGLALAEGRLTDAQLHFEKALALTKSGSWPEGRGPFFEAEAFGGLASLAERRADWPAARAALLARLEREPADGRARQRLGKVLFRLGRADEALEQLRKAAGDAKNLDPPAVTMGWLWDEKGDATQASSWMESAVRDAPDDARTHQALAVWLLRRGQPERARAEADRAAKLRPDDPELAGLRGLIARHLKDYDRAEAYFREARQRQPDDAQVARQLAVVLADQPEPIKHAEALALAQALARRRPDAESFSTLGWAFYRSGKLNEAEQSLRLAIREGTASAETTYYLARVLADRGQVAQAKELLRAAATASLGSPVRKDLQDLLARLEKTQEPAPKPAR